jgi:hypothetical protein
MLRRRLRVGSRSSGGVELALPTDRHRGGIASRSTRSFVDAELHPRPGRPYARDVGSADNEQAQVEVERSRRTRVGEAGEPSHVRERPGPLERLACGIGNRSFSHLVARMREGEGLLPDGRVDASVEAAIAAARGRGRPLERSVSAQLEPGLGQSLHDVRVHTDDGAAALARAVSARAFTVGSDIFFAPGEYRPGSRDGDHLIAHEVAHVIQQRGAPSAGPLTVSQPGDDLEREAEAVSRDLAG